MNNNSYLVTFSNLFERKYFDEHLEEFFTRHLLYSNKNDLKASITSLSNRFIEIKENKDYFLRYTLLNKFPKAKITRKVVKGKSARYYPVKAT